MLIEKTLRDYLKEVRSDSPAPGGGSVAAYSSALGASLTNMVMALTESKKAFAELPESEQNTMKDYSKKLVAVCTELEDIVDTDSTAFNDVIKALKMPKETDEEKKIRSEKIQEGYKIALEIPFRCAELGLEAMKMQKIFAQNGNINAITDVGVGCLLLQTGVEGALLNVTINLKSLKDEAFREETRKKVEDMLESSKKYKEETLAIVYKRLAE